MNRTVSLEQRTLLGAGVTWVCNLISFTAILTGNINAVTTTIAFIGFASCWVWIRSSGKLKNQPPTTPQTTLTDFTEVDN